MEFEIVLLIAAIGGGLFGAAIGGLPAFIFTGFAVIAGVSAAIAGSDYDFITNVAFGPVFGPHISFAGGVAAAAYARRAGILDNGKDILTGLTGLANPTVLAVGGLFGGLGYVIVSLLTPLIGSYTDAVALTVVISAVIVRLVFGRSGIFGDLDAQDVRDRGRLVPGGDQVWIPYQQGWLMTGVLGAGVGAISAFMFVSIYEVSPDLAPAGTVLGFGIAAASLIFLQFGGSIPVTHHMALPAAVAASVSIVAFGSTGALIVGIIGGVLGAVVGELSSRLLLIHGDTHIDPPANAIWIVTSVFLIGALIFG